ncbi:MAG: adenylate/guanylate cyclase domain-containing protein [Chitinophagaceae bacterium]
MLSQKTKRNILRIIPFGVIWFIFSLVYTLLEKGLLGDLNYYPSTGNPYNFSRIIFITPLSALLTGLLTGIMEILYFGKLFAHISFGKKILYKSIVYLLIIASFLVLLTIAANAIELQASFFNSQVLRNARAFSSSYAFLSIIIYMAAIIVVTQFYTELSVNLGQGVLANFFTGKYHRPTEEERIYMFLDMKSSTTIAEHLGHVRYFEMLREYYADLSDPIIDYSGEIYQYVGDEMVVSWKLTNGLQNNNCIRCFFALQDALNKQTAKYQQNFGLLPCFKASFHLGKVTTGEIGVIKKEIIFTGDVLNTTARIQGLCNTYQVDLLISGQLMEKLSLPASFKIQGLGENELRGRDEKIALFTILPA